MANTKYARFAVQFEYPEGEDHPWMNVDAACLENHLKEWIQHPELSPNQLAGVEEAGFDDVKVVVVSMR